MKPPVASSDDVLAAIADTITATGYPPSIRDLSRDLSVSLGTVHKRICELEEEGRIERVIVNNTTRQIRIKENT